MLSVNNLSVSFGKRTLFSDVNLKFTNGNCYGIIGANGSGKSTFLSVLSEKMDSSTGQIKKEADARISTLEQDHFQYDDYLIKDVVLSGHQKLYKIYVEKAEIYNKTDFTDADGIKAGKLEDEFAQLNGWEADSEIEKLLSGLNLTTKTFDVKMKEISSDDKVRVLLARSLFGSPDILLLDEPTNHLDFKTIRWLEDMIVDYPYIVIVVSHDRHFLNTICTHTIDIDFQKVELYHGNYDFWKDSREVLLELQKKSNLKKEQQIKKLEDFVARFSANASKSKQATSRKKSLEKISIDEIKPSSRRYPYFNFQSEKRLGNDIFSLNKLEVAFGEQIAKDITFSVNNEQKVAFISRDDLLIREFFNKIVTSYEENTDSKEIIWGTTVSLAYFPQNIEPFFQNDLTLLDWLAQYSPKDQSDLYLRSVLGKVLFSGEDALKKVFSCSGGEKMRLMFAKTMLTDANTFIFDQPLNHLDLESIKSVSTAFSKTSCGILFSSHDISLIKEIATVIVELTPNGAFFYEGEFEEFLDDKNIQEKIEKLYQNEQ